MIGRVFSRRVVCAVACGALLAGPSAAAAQQSCAFGEGTRTLVRSGLISHVSAPHFVCTDDVQIWADSAVWYQQLGMSHLMGSVRYVDRTRELRADTARYFSDQARLQATGHVYIRDETDGSQVENGVLVYLRQSDFRDVESMTVTTGADGVRPRALVAPTARDSTDRGPATREEPYSVVGDRIDLEGNARFRATGEVRITRDSLFAFADTAEFDQGDDRLMLDGSARVLSRGSELVGRSITMTGPGGDSSRVQARENASLVAEGVLLTSPQIVVFLVQGSLDRLVAIPLARRATGPGQAPVAAEAPTDSAAYARPLALLDEARLTGDSIEIVAPGERIERVVAVGAARSESTAGDSLNVDLLPAVARTDWLRGDTVVVTFRPRGSRAVASDSTTAVDSLDAAPAPLDTLAAALPAEGAPGRPGASAGDTATDQEIESVAAHGAASALYRLAPSDTTSRPGVDPPALHYVVGQRITIMMEDGQVSDLHVTGQTRGVHLEPLARRSTPDSLAVADSLALDTLALPDTSAARRDTTAVRGDTIVVAGRRPSGGEALGAWAARTHSLEAPGDLPFGTDAHRAPVARKEEEAWNP